MPHQPKLLDRIVLYYDQGVDDPLIVHFSYGTTDQVWFRAVRPVRSVTCFAHAGPCEINSEKICTTLGHLARSECSPQDRFTRAAGRKIALGRALRAGSYTYEQRAALWADFLTQTGVFKHVVLKGEKS